MTSRSWRMFSVIRLHGINRCGRVGIEYWLLTLVMAGTPIFAQTPAPPIAPDGELYGMLVTRIDEQKCGTGVVVGILEPEGKRVVAYGTMGIDNERPVDGDTVFDIGSITKVFTALLLSDMVQRGEVALDDPAQKYVPAGVHLPTRAGRQITLADLATHTAGLPSRPPDLVLNDPEQSHPGYSTDSLYRFLSTYVPTRDIGSYYQYSSVGFGLLGDVLSRRVGIGYEELLRRRIGQPLGMEDTRIAPTARMQTHTPTGYNSQRMPVKHERFQVLGSAGALRSTANDLLTFLEAILGYRKTALLPAMDAMLNTRRPGGTPPPSRGSPDGTTQIALAWNIYTDGHREIVWKNGGVSGFRAFLGYDLKRRLGVVALINAQTVDGVDDIGLHILDPSIEVDIPATPKVGSRLVRP